jgi:hypothetical protein
LIRHRCHSNAGVSRCSDGANGLARSAARRRNPGRLRHCAALHAGYKLPIILM